MPSKCFASWASPNWTRPPRRRDKNRSCSDQPQNPPPYLLGVTGHNVKHALAADVLSLEEAVRWAGGRPGSSAAASAGRERALEAPGGGADPGQTILQDVLAKKFSSAASSIQ